MRSRLRVPWSHVRPGRLLGAAVCLLSFLAGPSRAAAPGEGGPRLEVAAATAAYLAKVPPEKKARSDAYFEGGYWLQLWNVVYAGALYWILLAAGWSAAMRDRASRLTRRAWARTALYWVQFAALTTVLQFPLILYQEFIREHQYGLSTQTLGAWLGDFGTIAGVNVVLGAILFPILYAALRRAHAWWAWGAVVAIVFVAFVHLIAPVFILPLLNKYTPLEDPKVRDPILRLARANGIAVREVFVFDASRQTTRISANVSGLLGTERISLNDNLLKRCTLPEIEAVMGHEMGHYVLHHGYKGMVFFSVLIVLGALFLRGSFDRIVRRCGVRWRVEGIGDPAGMPLLIFLFMFYFFLITPVTNSIVRTMEAEADLFGLNAARQPDGAAEVALKLGEYRKLDPSPLEEIVFFDHPSGRSRIAMAMRFKAESPAAAEGSPEEGAAP